MKIKNLDGDVIREVPGNTLRGADLRGANLEGAYLRDANLKGANLRGANLKGANLRDANLRGAYLRDADLEGANLKGANLEDAYLEGAYLRGANLRDAYLKGANLEGAYLEGAYLKGANLRDANLRGADLRDANLKGANLEGAYLEGAYLRGAKNLPYEYVNICSRDMIFVFRSLKSELPGLREFLVAGKVDGTQYEGDCACLIGSLANTKKVNVEGLCEFIPYEGVLWKPSMNGQKYHYSDGHKIWRWLWDSDAIDLAIFKRQQLFKTREEAQKADERRIAYMELVREIARQNEGWKPDWSDDNQRKYHFWFSHKSNRIIHDYNYETQSRASELYLRSSEGFKEVLETLGEEKIKLAMGWE